VVDANGTVTTFACDVGGEAVDVTTTGTRAVIGSCTTNNLALVDLTSGPPSVLSTIPSGALCVEELDIAPNGEFGIATGTGDGKVSKFTLSPFAVTGTGGPFATGARGGSPQDVHVDNTSTRAVLPMFDSLFLQIIDVSGTTPAAVATIPTDRTHHGVSLSEANNDTILATGTTSGVTVASRSALSVTTVLPTPGTPESVRIKCDGSRAVVETSAGLMWIDMTTSPPSVSTSIFGAARTDRFSTSSVAFTRDGTRLFVAGSTTIDVYDATVDPPSLLTSAAVDTGADNVATLPCAKAPVAADQSVTTAEDTAKSITLTATDVDSPSLTFSVVTPPSHGSLSVISDIACGISGTSSSCATSVTYTPAKDYNGPESFTFKANDGRLDSSPATVSITVTPVNDGPSAVSQSVVTAEDLAVSIKLSGLDIDSPSLTFSIVTGPSRGTLSPIGAASCTAVPNGTGTAGSSCSTAVLYTPTPNSFGSDAFTFTVSDGSLTSDTATVSITVVAVDDPPVLTVPGPITANEGASISFTVSATDLDGPFPLIFSVSNLPAGATLTPRSATSALFAWTPNSAQGGPNPYLVQFTVSDGQLSDTKMVSIKVNDTIADRDGDGVPDAVDNCPDEPNANQVDVCHNSPQTTAGTQTVTQVDRAIPVTFTATVVNDKTDIAFLPPDVFTVSCKVINNATGGVIPVQRIPESGPFVLNLGEVNRPGDLVKVLARTSATFSTTFDLKISYPDLPNGSFTTTCTYVQFGQTLNPTADDPPLWVGEIEAPPQTIFVGQYQFSGFFSPLPGAKFGQTNTVPVKFALKDGTGAFVTNCTCTLTFQRLDGNGNPIPGTQLPAVPTSGSGNQFKYDPKNNQYLFTLASRSLPVGPVQLQVNLHDGSVLRTVNIVVTP
jgi:Big-like domain-containing protein